jgi:hypothetical protein
MSQPVWSVTVHGRGFDVLRSNRSYLDCMPPHRAPTPDSQTGSQASTRALPMLLTCLVPRLALCRPLRRGGGWCSDRHLARIRLRPHLCSLPGAAARARTVALTVTLTVTLALAPALTVTLALAPALTPARPHLHPFPSSSHHHHPCPSRSHAPHLRSDQVPPHAPGNALLSVTLNGQDFVSGREEIWMTRFEANYTTNNTETGETIYTPYTYQVRANPNPNPNLTLTLTLTLALTLTLTLTPTPTLILTLTLHPVHVPGRGTAAVSGQRYDPPTRPAEARGRPE